MHIYLSKIVNLPTAKRLPAYLYILQQLKKNGQKHVSSSHLAGKMNIEPILVRKDIEAIQVSGTPRIGYSVENLINTIESYFEWNQTQHAILFGVGELGVAILGNQELANLGLRIVAAFDSDPRKVNKFIHGVMVFDLLYLHEIIEDFKVNIAILCFPSGMVQCLVDELVSAGVTGVWSFSSQNLTIPDSVVTQKDDLTSGFVELCAKLRRNELVFRL